jgi:cytoskeletal protein RodZ
MANEILKKYAFELKSAREAKGLTIDEIHSHTRIDKKFLEALENGNFSIMPEVYIRAFIKEYAGEVDLDPDEMLKKYDLAKSGTDFETDASPDETKIAAENKEAKEFTDPAIERKEKTEAAKNNNLIYYGIGGVLLIIILYFIFAPAGDEKIVVEQKYTPAAVEEPSTKVVQKPIQQKVKAKPFEVELSGLDTVWIRAQIDQSKTEEFTLVPAVSRVITVQDTLKLIVGNVGGIGIKLDNKPIDISGKKGQVKNLVLTRNGLVK